jgi:hypothetical protein
MREVQRTRRLLGVTVKWKQAPKSGVKCIDEGLGPTLYELEYLVVNLDFTKSHSQLPPYKKEVYFRYASKASTLCDPPFTVPGLTSFISIRIIINILCCEPCKTILEARPILSQPGSRKTLTPFVWIARGVKYAVDGYRACCILVEDRLRKAAY